ncbi:MAG: RDD family protein [Nitrospirae bacterium]|nr:RDD family protein [Nitrospirota bacterium]
MPTMTEDANYAKTETSDAHEYHKAGIFNRFVARVIDLIIAAAFSMLLYPVGFFAGLTYILIADGFFDGKSLGKKLINLRTIKSDGELCSYKESVLRNITIAGGYLFFFIPYVGWLFTLAIVGVETLIIIGNEKGLRIGDELAKTIVIENGGVKIVK